MCQQTATAAERPVPGQLPSDPAQRAVTAAVKDTTAQRREFLFGPPASWRPFLRGCINDPRDEPLLFLLLDVCCTTAPAAAALFCVTPSLPAIAQHLLCAAYLAASFAAYLQRFLLGLHYSSHRPLFRRPWGLLNGLMPFVLAPLFGVPCGIYSLHHCIMHHVEGNESAGDLSSTEPYQRDSFAQFLFYWARHSFGSWVELPLYAVRQQRYGLVVSCTLAEVAYLGGMALLWRANWVATLWVLVLPFVISSFALMIGNWSQHAFINPACPRSPFGMTYSCVAHADNQRSFNDGYHVQHHLNSRLHWSELPARFLETMPLHAAADALVFEGVGWFDVAVAVFARRHDFLAARFVHFSERFAAMSPEEVKAMLLERLRPIPRTAETRATNKS